MASVTKETDERAAYLQSYLHEVQALFQLIRNWLVSESLLLEEQPITLSEPYAGEYSTTELVIHDGGKTASVRPKGAWFVGTEGRVDVEGPDQSYILIFTKDEGWRWVDESWVVALQPLTRELFLRLLKDCLG